MTTYRNFTNTDGVSVVRLFVVTLIKMTRVKIGLRSLTCEGKVEMSKRILAGLKSVKELKKEKELIDELYTATESFEKAIEMAAFGDKRGIGARNLCEKQLDTVIRKAAAFVNHQSKGDETMITAAGFELRKRNNKPTELETPEGLKIKRTEKCGELKLGWKPVKNSRNYIVQFSSGKTVKENEWNTHFSTRSRSLLQGLKPGKTYSIRILAVGAKGVSAPSETVRVMAT